jgi:hypothetical protein
MKIFNDQPQRPRERSRDRATAEKAVKKNVPEVKKEKPYLSPSDIRDKVEGRKTEQSNASKIDFESSQKRVDKEQKLVEVNEKFTEADGETPTKGAMENDPSNPATRGKLKSALSMGMINFSDKERAALEAILKEE